MLAKEKFLLEELAARALAAAPKIDPKDLLDQNFPEQTKFILDPAKLKAAFCTRRAAKSYTGGIYLIKEALEHPGCNCLFIGLTRASAQNIVWKDILKVIDRKYDLGATFNESKLTMTLTNGSVIFVTGVDTSEDEMNKLLGRKYRLAVLDEASMFSVDQKNLIYGVLKPAVADDRGTICVLGTSSNNVRTLFYQITRKDGPREAGWSVHEWTAHQNPYVAKQWQEELDEIDRERPLFKKTPLYRQWYLNEWVIDENALVYHFNETLNTTFFLPRELTDWVYILGLDLAHSPDSTAFVVGCFHPADPTLYIVHCEKHLGMDFTAVGKRIKELDAQFNFQVKIVDGANKMGVAELNQRHGTGLINAEKTGKVDFINLMNGDLRQGKIKLLPGAAQLIEEWNTLTWVTDGGKITEPRKEHQGIHNDLADSCLYLWRYAYTYLYSPNPQAPKLGSLASWEPAHLAHLIEQVRKEQNPEEYPLPDPLDWDSN